MYDDNNANEYCSIITVLLLTNYYRYTEFVYCAPGTLFINDSDTVMASPDTLI